jgi:hypothetical protein
MGVIDPCAVDGAGRVSMASSTGSIMGAMSGIEGATGWTRSIWEVILEIVLEFW